MPRKRWSEEQIIYAVKQAEAGKKELREENRKLKHVVADLTLDRHILQEIVAKKL